MEMRSLGICFSLRVYPARQYSIRARTDRLTIEAARVVLKLQELPGRRRYEMAPLFLSPYRPQPPATFL